MSERWGNAKPIETTYKGYRFRSRLEARWAVFFDTAGIAYEYEVEGFELDGQRYLPDFWLPELRWFVEVKPVEPSESEVRKCVALSVHSNRFVTVVVGTPAVPRYLEDATGFTHTFVPWETYDPPNEHLWTPCGFYECPACGKVSITEHASYYIPDCDWSLAAQTEYMATVSFMGGLGKKYQVPPESLLSYNVFLRANLPEGRSMHWGYNGPRLIEAFERLRSARFEAH